MPYLLFQGPTGPTGTLHTLIEAVLSDSISNAPSVAPAQG